MSDSPHPVYRVLARLDAAKIHYTLTCVREDTIMVKAHVPGQHYEIEVFADGEVEVEIFRSDGHIGGQELIDQLLTEFAN